jgi:hypothetical protein
VEANGRVIRVVVGPRFHDESDRIGGSRIVHDRGSWRDACGACGDGEVGLRPSGPARPVGPAPSAETPRAAPRGLAPPPERPFRA